MTGWPRRVRPLISMSARFYALWWSTLRVRIIMPDGSRVRGRAYVHRSEIFAVCERDALALAGTMRDAGFTTLVADGSDGDFAALFLGTLGCRSVRGSSLRNGLRAMMQLRRELADLPGPGAIVVDGPLGPDGVAREGIATLARSTGRAIVPVAASALWRITFKRSWSRIYLPLPFSKVAIVVGKSMVAEPGDPRRILAKRITAAIAELRLAAVAALEVW